MTDFTPRLARNLAKLPPYLFARIDALKAEAKTKGADLIDVSIGDPDQPTFKHIVRAGSGRAKRSWKLPDFTSANSMASISSSAIASTSGV